MEVTFIKLWYTLTIASPPTGIVFYTRGIIFSIGPLALLIPAYIWGSWGSRRNATESPSLVCVSSEWTETGRLDDIYVLHCQGWWLYANTVVSGKHTHPGLWSCNSLSRFGTMNDSFQCFCVSLLPWEKNDLFCVCMYEWMCVCVERAIKKDASVFNNFKILGKFFFIYSF